MRHRSISLRFAFFPGTTTIFVHTYPHVAMGLVFTLEGCAARLDWSQRMDTLYARPQPAEFSLLRKVPPPQILVTLTLKSLRSPQVEWNFTTTVCLTLREPPLGKRTPLWGSTQMFDILLVDFFQFIPKHYGWKYCMLVWITGESCSAQIGASKPDVVRVFPDCENVPGDLSVL